MVGCSLYVLVVFSDRSLLTSFHRTKWGTDNSFKYGRLKIDLDPSEWGKQFRHSL